VLELDGYDVSATSGLEALELVRGEFLIVLPGLRLIDADGLILREVQRTSPHSLTITLSGYASARYGAARYAKARTTT
jgi:hypothetical protein